MIRSCNQMLYLKLCWTDPGKKERNKQSWEWMSWEIRWDGREQPLLSFKGLVSDWPHICHVLSIANMPTGPKCLKLYVLQGQLFLRKFKKWARCWLHPCCWVESSLHKDNPIISTLWNKEEVQRRGDSIYSVMATETWP